MTGNMECFTLLLPDFGRRGKSRSVRVGLFRQAVARQARLVMGGLFRCGLAGKVRYVMLWSGALWKREARQGRRG